MITEEEYLIALQLYDMLRARLQGTGHVVELDLRAKLYAAIYEYKTEEACPTPRSTSTSPAR